MILADHEIMDLSLGKSLIMPFDPESINPCSYDLMLGQNYILDDYLHLKEPIVKSFDNENLMLEPGQFILVDVAETLRMPKNLVGMVALKSSAARMGIGHALAGFVDAGYSGRLTLELMNNSQKRSIEIRAGMKVVQIVFHKMSSKPNKSYGETGHYQSDSCVVGSRVTL